MKKLRLILLALVASIVAGGCVSAKTTISADNLTELIHKPAISILLDSKTPVCGAKDDFSQVQGKKVRVIINQPLTETTSLIFRSELEHGNGKWLCKSVVYEIVQPTEKSDNLNWEGLATHIWEGILLEENKQLSITISFEQTETKEYLISKFYTIDLEKLFSCENPLTEQLLGQQFNMNVYQMNPYVSPNYSYVENQVVED
ncbi:hypothetical protein IM774_12520 [Erysipelotrichaceae bacterium RD49]|nr:hypothetical protein [Erysipelotrichaceae bacterium RD49]